MRTSTRGRISNLVPIHGHVLGTHFIGLQRLKEDHRVATGDFHIVCSATTA